MTGVAAVNAVGEKLPIFEIGKSQNPGCFKNVESFSSRYRSQQKVWMDSVLLEEWVRALDRKVSMEIEKLH